MANELKPYCVLVQAGPEEIELAPDAVALGLERLRDWPSIKDMLVVLPDLEGARQAQAKLEGWGYRAMIGDAYNVCRRLLEASPGQAYTVRVLAIWKHTDLEYVDRLVREMQTSPCDLVAAPRDFDATLAADVASMDALKVIATLDGDSAEVKRAQFNPWGYIESHPERFTVHHHEPAPRYDTQRVEAILAEQRCHPENEFFGRDYAGSRYHFIADQIPPGLRILDIACGSGFGSQLLSQNARFVLGVDYLESYIEQARGRFPENERLQFIPGDAQVFEYNGGDACFDLAVSFHTLEHVPDDVKMMASLFRNVRPGGQLIAEVPLLAQRPLGVPINPYHLREYTEQQFVDLVESAGFCIERRVGVSRGFYVAPTLARDALQLWARKPE